jgi:tRNA1Val (adenine37-N6)-methyltransferase
MTLVELVLKAKSLLSQQGEIWIIIPSDRSESITKEAEQSGVFLHQQIYLYGKPNRHVRDVLVLGKSKPVDLVRQSFTIRDENGSYTREYIELTHEFHWEKGGK